MGGARARLPFRRAWRHSSAISAAMPVQGLEQPRIGDRQLPGPLPPGDIVSRVPSVPLVEFLRESFWHVRVGGSSFSASR
jgi:hypothetical protein